MSGKNLDELEQLRRSDVRYHAVLLASAAIVWIASPEGEQPEALANEVREFFRPLRRR